jgi:hypothetical protein
VRTFRELVPAPNQHDRPLFLGNSTFRTLFVLLGLGFLV